MNTGLRDTSLRTMYRSVSTRCRLSSSNKITASTRPNACAPVSARFTCALQVRRMLCNLPAWTVFRIVTFHHLIIQSVFKMYEAACTMRSAIWPSAQYNNKSAKFVDGLQEITSPTLLGCRSSHWFATGVNDKQRMLLRYITACFRSVS